MTDIFLKILNMSLSATFVCGAVILLRLLLRRAPKWITLLLWVAVAIRLACPISFESNVSMMPTSEAIPQNIGIADTPAIHSGIGAVDNAVNPMLPSGTLAPTPEYSANPMQVLTFIASIVWVSGISLMLLYTVVSYIRLKLRVRISLPMEGEHNVRLCDSIDSPFILGFIRPVIYLPLGIDEADAEHVLAHERCHIKRFDFIWKPLGFMLLAIHWFNPIMWVAYVLLCRDIECACDEAVLKKSGSEIKSTYATALINCSVSRKSIAACPLAFGETGLKMRVKNVLSYKKPTVWLILAGLIVCAAVGIFLLTDPASISITELHEEETGSYEDIFENVETLTVYQGKMTSDVYEKDTVANVIDTLKEVRLKKHPISRDRSDNRDMTNRVQLGDGMQLCFSEDFGEFWIYTGTKPTLSYKVVNPEVAKSAVIEKSYFSSEVGFTVGKSGSDLVRVTARLTGIVADSAGGYLKVMFNNLTDKEITYGDKFSLYRIEANGNAVTCMSDDKMFDLIARSLKDHSSEEHKFYLDKCDLTKEGKYRFETDISMETSDGYKSYAVWFEFYLPHGGTPSEEAEVSPLRTGTLYVYSDDRSGYYIEPHIFLSDINNSCIFTGTSFLSSATLIGTYVLDSDNLVITHVAPEYETKYVFDVDSEGNLIFNESLSTAPPIPPHVDENDVIPLYNDGTMFKKLKKVEDSSYMEVFSELAENAKFLDDSKTFDIDRDGNEEDCYLIDGGLSGVSSLELIVVDEYNTKYCLFYIFVPAGKYSFEECDDGEIRLKINTHGDDRFSDGTEIFYDIGIDEDGYITFTNGEDTLFRH